MPRLTDALRRRLAKEQRGRCWYCSLRMEPGDMTWEHIVARRHGGDNRLGNLAISHAKCNSAVGTCPPGHKHAMHSVGWTYGSDAFFLLVVQLRAMTNAHDDYRDLRRRRPKRPALALHEANVAMLVSRLPEEFRLPLAA